MESPENAPSGKVARLRGVRARTDDGGVGEPVDVRQAITLEMEYEVLEEGYELLPHFIIRNEEGAFVFTSLDNDPKWRGLHRPTGCYTSSVKIPGNFLAEGMHYVNCALITFRPNITQFAEKQVIAFRVLDYLEGDSVELERGKV